jgi:hypothetical protein
LKIQVKLGRCRRREGPYCHRRSAAADKHRQVLRCLFPEEVLCSCASIEFDSAGTGRVTEVALGNGHQAADQAHAEGYMQVMR